MKDVLLWFSVGMAVLGLALMFSEVRRIFLRPADALDEHVCDWSAGYVVTTLFGLVLYLAGCALLSAEFGITEWEIKFQFPFLFPMAGFRRYAAIVTPAAVVWIGLAAGSAFLFPKPFFVAELRHRICTSIRLLLAFLWMIGVATGIRYWGPDRLLDAIGLALLLMAAFEIKTGQGIGQGDYLGMRIRWPSLEDRPILFIISTATKIGLACMFLRAVPS